MTHYFKCAAILAAASFATTQSQAAVVLFQPDSATATSEFNSLYDIGNAIDGSGLPAGFAPTDAHANYSANNHWTTQANQVPGNAVATFFFDSPVTIGTFFMWNHRSNSISSNSNYEVTNFDLELFDNTGGSLFLLEDITALGETPTAQAFGFTPVADVSSVKFTVNANQGLGINNPNYTGVGEVAFSETQVPEPASVALLGLGSLLISRRSK